MPNPPAPEPAFTIRAPARRPERSHRGGAWKVAYADFVTALMALFIVLWLMNAGSAVKSSVSGYFRDPRGYTHRLGAGPARSGEGLRVAVHNVSEVRAQIEQALHGMPGFQKISENVRFSVTGEGLRIDLLETEQGLFFVTGNASPTANGERLLRLLAEELGSLPNHVVIEGHTDSRPFRNGTPSAGYTNWELSADRANAARRMLHGHGLPSEKVVEVRGYADRKLLEPGDPSDPRNRRVSLVVKFTGE